MSTSDAAITVDGTIIDAAVNALTIQGVAANIDATTKAFRVADIPLRNKTNDLVVKYFDGDRNVLGKYVYTVYSANPDATAAENTTPNTE